MTPANGMESPPRLRRWRFLVHLVRAVAFVIAVPLAVVAAVLGALALRVDIPPLRREVVARVNPVLGTIFEGKIVIDSVGKLDLGGIDGANARLLDPSGKVVAAAYGVRARIALGALLRSLVSGKGPIDVHLTDVSVRAADFDFDRDDAGSLGIVRAFAPRTTNAPVGPAGRDVRVAIDHVQIDHAWVHGLPVSGLPIDADVDALGAEVTVDPARIAVDVARFSLLTRGMPYHADARGTAEAHVVLPAPSGGVVGVKVAWNGVIGGIAEVSQSSLDGDVIDATFDAPVVPPEAIRALWPASPIDGAAGIHADVRGALSKLATHLRITQGDASLDVAGPLVLGPGQTADLHIDARAIDPHALVSSAPSSRLSATGDVSLARSAEGALSAKATIDFGGGHVSGAKVPTGKVRATFSRDAKGSMRGDATVSANEPGAPTVLSLHLVPKGRSYELAFDGDTHVPELDAVPRLGAVAHGQSDVKTHGKIDFGRGEVDVNLTAEIRGLGHDLLQVEHATVSARLRGSLTSPKLDVTLHGDLLDFGGYKFSEAQLDVHGPASGAVVHLALDADGDGTPDFSADGLLSLGSVTKVEPDPGAPRAGARSADRRPRRRGEARAR